MDCLRTSKGLLMILTIYWFLLFTHLLVYNIHIFYILQESLTMWRIWEDHRYIPLYSTIWNIQVIKNSQKKIWLQKEGGRGLSKLGKVSGSLPKTNLYIKGNVCSQNHTTVLVSSCLPFLSHLLLQKPSPCLWNPLKSERYFLYGT